MFVKQLFFLLFYLCEKEKRRVEQRLKISK